MCSLVMGFYLHDLLVTSLRYIEVVLGGINILLPVYGITNLKRYSVFHGILIKHN